MNNFLLIIAAFLVAVLTALFAVPPMINWNDFRGVFEEEASRLLDREVRVRGEVSVRILPVPYVSFEKVRIADAPGIPGSFARAEQFKMWLAVPPLLRGVIEARQIELEQPVIRLRTEADGTGNWRKLQIRKRDLAYIPSEVALNSVRITDGTLLFEADGGQEITKLNKISGELIAGSLTGPFKFIGTMPLGSDPGQPAHEVRLSTAHMEDNGDARFNGSIRSADNRSVHSINGTMHDLLGQARVDGILTSRGLPAQSPAGSPAKPVGEDLIGSKDATATGIATAYEMTTTVTLDAKALRLDAIDIAFRNKDRQQSLKGNAITSWRDGVVTETHLAAGWLDLDAIAGTRPGESPLMAVERLLMGGVEPLGAGVTSVDIKIDQANLAGTSISGLNARLVRRDGVTKIDALRASLPGRSELAVDGFIERREAGLQFDGNVLMQGASFADLARWLRIGLDEKSLNALTTAFKVNGNVRVRPKSVDLSEAIIALAETTAEGTLSYNWQGRPVLAATIDADVLKLDRFSPAALAPERIARILGFPLSEARAGAPLPHVDWLRATDISLNLRARQISDGTRLFSNVDVDFGRNSDTLNLGRFNLTWEPGLTIGVSGKLTQTATKPRGNLHATVTAANNQAAARLVELTGLVAGTVIPTQALAGRTPLRLAIETELDTARDPAAPAVSGFSRMIADGTIGHDRIRIAAQTKGSLADWQNQPGEVEARIAGQDAVTAVRWLSGEPIGIAAKTSPAPRQVATSRPDRSASPATITMTAVGIPHQKMKSAIVFNAGDALQANFIGDLRFGESGGAIKPEWSGHLDIGQTTTTMLARLLWPAWRQHLPRAAAKGRVAIATTPDGYTFQPDLFEVGRTKISGKLSIEPARGSVLPTLSGSITMNEASLPLLSSVVLNAEAAERSQPPAAAAEQDLADSGERSMERDDTSNGASNAWPDQSFKFSHFAGARTNVKVDIGQLALNVSGTRLNEVSFQLESAPGRLSITDFAGIVNASGSKDGAVNARISFEEQQAGARVIANVAATRIALRNWAPQLAEAGRLSGMADLNLNLNGQALSPRSLASLIGGTGEIRLTAASVPGLTSGDVTAAARKVIDGELELEDLPVQIAELVSRQSVALGDRAFKIRVSNGSLALPTFTLGRGEAAVRNTTFVDLPRWWIDSQWTITPAPQPRPDAPNETVPLPSIALIYSGSLSAPGEIAAKIDLGDLERELVVRKMEANVARLEQLRREDEARAAAERERQRRIEDEQQRSVDEENKRRLELRNQQLLPQQQIQPSRQSGGGQAGGGFTSRVIRPPQPQLAVPQ